MAVTMPEVSGFGEDRAEEGITAAAYVVVSIVGGTWTIEECGDRDPSGARVGAILQALIAREPAERRSTIRAWLPRGFVPPQVTIVSAKPSTEVVMVRALGSLMSRGCPATTCCTGVATSSESASICSCARPFCQCRSSSMKDDHR